VAGVAGGRQAFELAGGRVLVAILALRESVRADQRKTVLVILNSLQRNLPALDRVATRAIGAKLATMDVRMAVCALGADVFEDQVGVTLDAIHFLVHAAKWISSQVVIKFGIGSDGFPA
jgi:hypothetical protein